MVVVYILKFGLHVNLFFCPIIVYRFDTTLYNLLLNIESTDYYLLENSCISSVKNR